MDNRLRPAPRLPKKFIKKYGFQYFTSGENADYLAEDLVGIHTGEEEAFLAAGDTCFNLLRRAAQTVVDTPNLLRLFGIPEQAHSLLKWSIENEWDDYLIGRFDFAGGLDGQPIKLLEFNADTCSLLVETAFLQPEILKEAKQNAVKNDLLSSLEGRLRSISGAGNILLTDLGFPEDQLSASVIGRAARQAGYDDVGTAPLEEVNFDPEDAVLLETAGMLKAYDVMYKAYPWDFILFEEPELWDLLSEMVRGKKVKLLNPAWAMLLQCKGIMAVAWEQNPNHPLLLETGWSAAGLRARQYVSKPIWGRMGENVSVFHSPNYPTAQTEGDFAGSPLIFQQLANFNQDRDTYRYQVSTFHTDHACAIAVRRQDDIIMDDDAEFIAAYRL